LAGGRARTLWRTMGKIALMKGFVLRPGRVIINDARRHWPDHCTELIKGGMLKNGRRIGLIALVT
jgi:hypothetical protein